ncbi:MAG: hypothetical protein PHX04_06580 [Bacilli bacterium]|nr:hypothetical protein [Bacilli bacterium]
MEIKYQTQKVLLNNGWYEKLLKEIEINNTNISAMSKEESEFYLERNNRIESKLEKFKKINNNNEIYYYFFPRELRDLFWILLENSILKDKNN